MPSDSSRQSPAVAQRDFPGRRWLHSGLGLSLLGIIGYVVQLSLGRLVTPWYMPCAAVIGIILVAVSLWRARSVWRGLALLFVVLLAGAEWAFLAAMRLPAYSGPAEVGKPMPAFATVRADGAPFTQSDLEGEQHSVVVSFRGRW